VSELRYQLRWALPLWIVGVLTNWWPDNRVAYRLRGMLFRPFVRQCGCNFQLGRNVTLVGTDRLIVGDNVYIAHGCWINCLGNIIIEDEVIIGPYVVMSSLQHVFSEGSARFGGSIARPIVIGRGSWLAAHVTVTCGVRLGRSNLVAANACAIEDTADGVVLGGVPARTIGVTKDGIPEFHSRTGKLGR
jgi:acetyltransferase-like isoleucine patch superfamily enzyme